MLRKAGSVVGNGGLGYYGGVGYAELAPQGGVGRGEAYCDGVRAGGPKGINSFEEPGSGRCGGGLLEALKAGGHIVGVDCVGDAFEAGVLMGGEVGADADSGTDSAGGKGPGFRKESAQLTRRIRFKQRGVELPNDPVVGLIARKSGVERRHSAGLVVAKQQSLVGLLGGRAALRQGQ